MSIARMGWRASRIVNNFWQIVARTLSHVDFLYYIYTITNKQIHVENIKEQIQSWVAAEAQPLLTGYYQSQLRNLPIPELTVKFGQKYAQVWEGRTIWAFVALTDEVTKAQRVGDLLKPASWRKPAKHSRGNILTGTAAFGPYGPNYMDAMNPLK